MDCLLERTKCTFDYLKHITTLSTGCIIVMATFMEKLFKRPAWQSLVVVAIIAFLTAVVGAVIAFTIGLIQFPGLEHREQEWENTVGGTALVLTWVGFLVGVFSLAVFTIKNLG